MVAPPALPVAELPPPKIAPEPPPVRPAGVRQYDVAALFKNVGVIPANGVPVDYLVFDDEGHGLQKQRYRIAAQAAYLELLDAHLR